MASSNHEYTGYSKPIPKQTVPEIRSDPREIREKESWLRWLVRGFRSERSHVRSSVTSTSLSTFL